jgi:tRNA threonylcarbamoyladenosine biosynthesis protein TsaE
VVEWGGGLAEGLAADRLEVTITVPAGAPDPDATAGPDQRPRTVRLAGHGDRWDTGDSARLAFGDALEAL